MTDLRTAAQQALEALESRCGTNAEERGPAGAITALKAALAEPDWQDLYLKEKKRADMWRDKYESVAGAEQRIHPLADGDKVAPTEPVAWYHVPHPNNGISPVVSMFQQHEPSLYAVAVPLFIREQL